MTHSMTGFARSSVTTGGVTITVELRSVNNRFLDLHIRCPDSLRQFEHGWRKKISDRVHRGKLELQIKLDDKASFGMADIDLAALSDLMRQLDQISKNIPDSTPPDTLSLLSVPGVLSSPPADELLLEQCANQALDDALSSLALTRQEEGEKMASVVLSRVAAMGELLGALKKNLPTLKEHQQQRLLDRLAQIGVEPDAKRLEEELVYSAQKADVDEELDRLEAHLEAITKALRGSAPCGRRLDFLMQELNREANTLSSKATALSTTEIAVEFKVLIEQMREQIQNIE